MRKPRAAVGSRPRKQTSSRKGREKHALNSGQLTIPDGEELGPGEKLMGWFHWLRKGADSSLKGLIKDLILTL